MLESGGARRDAGSRQRKLQLPADMRKLHFWDWLQRATFSLFLVTI
jgi:hypothetical protein